MIRKEEILELSKINQDFCISIFIPTHRAGEETLKGQDALALKNSLKDIREQLKKQKLRTNQVEDLLKPSMELVDDSEFWRHQSDGLVIFITNGFFRKYTVPINFEKFNYISNEFYVKPLMQLFSEDDYFYLLILKADKVLLYKETRYSITKIDIKDLVPSQVEDVVGYDYEQKNLQFRTQQGNSGAGMYHGHGEGKDDEKNELLRYFRAVNNGLMTILNADQTLPMVIACLDFHFPIYKEINSYQNIFPQHLSSNMGDIDVLLLHEKALNLLSPLFKKEREEKINLFSQFQGTERTSSDLKEILTAAISGKIDTLFMESRADIFGIYNPEKMKMVIYETHQTPNISLMNFAAAEVFSRGGRVFLMEKEDMPDFFSTVNALYRY